MSKDKFQSNFSGIWLSTYTYHSSVRDAELESKHYVKAYIKDNHLIFETVPEANDSYMLARFSIDDDVATGTWQESTDPKGDYKGVTYHGAGQLLFSADKKSLQGKWVGFGKEMEVKTGSWKLTYLGEDISIIPNK